MFKAVLPSLQKGIFLKREPKKTYQKQASNAVESIVKFGVDFKALVKSLHLFLLPNCLMIIDAIKHSCLNYIIL